MLVILIWGQPLKFVNKNEKVKSKIVPFYCFKADTESGDLAPLIFNLNNIWSWVVNFKPRQHYSRE